jgi:hypothetical protein
MNYLDDMRDDEGIEPQAAEKPWAALYVQSDDCNIKAHREEACVRVRDYFEQNCPLPEESRVACIFAKDDCIKSQLNRDVAARGLFLAPVEGLDLTCFPPYVHDIVAPIDQRTSECAFPYAGMILLHGSTCETDIGLTLTFAHELQHFLQYTNAKPLWVMNKLLMCLHNEEFKVWWDFPVEVEARVTAKKVAECLFGAELVREHIKEKIKARITCDDAKDWEFVQGIVSSVPYNLGDCTRPLVRRHRRQLDELRQRCQEDADAAVSRSKISLTLTSMP